MRINVWRRLYGQAKQPGQYPGRHRRIYVLIKHAGTYAWPVYEPAAGTLLKLSPVELLNLIAANVDTPTAFVTPEEVEEASHACIEAWCGQSGVSPAEIERVCALYLKPENEGDTANAG